MIRSGLGSGVKVRGEGRHPSRDDQVAQVGDVIAVQVSQQQGGQSVRADTGGRHPLLYTSPAVDEKRLTARAYKCRRPRPSGVGDGTTGAE